jgi:Ca2+-dependent lipid-binding protein
VGKTEVVKKTLNPKWQELTLELDVCGGLESTLLIECFDWDGNGKHDLIGCVEANLKDFLQKVILNFKIV